MIKTQTIVDDEQIQFHTTYIISRHLVENAINEQDLEHLTRGMAMMIQTHLLSLISKHYEWQQNLKAMEEK